MGHKYRRAPRTGQWPTDRFTERSNVGGKRRNDVSRGEQGWGMRKGVEWVEKRAGSRTRGSTLQKANSFNSLGGQN